MPYWNPVHPDHAAFYSSEGLGRVRRHLVPDGLFALWADRGADPSFTERLRSVFGKCEARTIRFPYPITDGESEGTVYLAGETV